MLNSLVESWWGRKPWHSRRKEDNNTDLKLEQTYDHISWSQWWTSGIAPVVTSFGAVLSINISCFNLIGKQRGVRRHFTAHFDRDNVAVRQITLTNTYNRLVELSQVFIPWTWLCTTTHIYCFCQKKYKPLEDGINSLSQGYKDQRPKRTIDNQYRLYCILCFSASSKKPWKCYQVLSF